MGSLGPPGFLSFRGATEKAASHWFSEQWSTVDISFEALAAAEAAHHEWKKVRENMRSLGEALPDDEDPLVALKAKNDRRRIVVLDARAKLLLLLRTGEVASYGLTKDRLIIQADPVSWRHVQDFSAVILVSRAQSAALVEAVPLIREDDLLAVLVSGSGRTVNTDADPAVSVSDVGSNGRQKLRRNYADELIARAFGLSPPRKDEGKPGMIVAQVLAQIRPDEKKPAPSRQTILRALGWQR